MEEARRKNAMEPFWRQLAPDEIPAALRAEMLAHGEKDAKSEGAADAASAPSIFACAHRVREDEVSALVPHANNIVILGWIDRIAELHGAHAGAARETVARDGRMWFVARHEIDYLGESFVGDALVIATWIEKLGRTSLTRATVIARADDGDESDGSTALKPLVRASSRWAFVDLATRKPAAIPDTVRQALVGV
jgi:acyl-CoA thioester hydrolase